VAKPDWRIVRDESGNGPIFPRRSKQFDRRDPSSEARQYCYRRSHENQYCESSKWLHDMRWDLAHVSDVRDFGKQRRWHVYLADVCNSVSSFATDRGVGAMEQVPVVTI
jgi:hypothetical protein